MDPEYVKVNDNTLGEQSVQVTNYAVEDIIATIADYDATLANLTLARQVWIDRLAKCDDLNINIPE